MHAETVLLVDHREPQIMESHRLLKQSMRADRNIDPTRSEALQDALALLSLFAPGEQSEAEPKPGRKRPQALGVLTRQDFGGGHQRGLPARLRRARHRHKRHDGLAGADIALKQPEHPFGLLHVGADLLDCALLAAGQLVGQGLRKPPHQRAVPAVAPAWGPPPPGAHQRQRELARQQLIIGQPTPRQGLGLQGFDALRPVQRPQSLGERRKAVLRQPGRVLPLGEPRQPVHRSRRRLGEDPRGQALRHAIDRLDRRHGAEGVLLHDPVGMDDLAAALPQFDLARDEADFSLRQHLTQATRIGVEEDQRHVAAFILDHDAIRRAAAPGRARPVLGNPRGESRRLADGRVEDGPGEAAVHPGMGKMEHKVDDAGRTVGFSQQPVVELGEFRPHARQGGDGREQRIEKRRAHGHGLADFEAVRHRARDIAPVTSRSWPLPRLHADKPAPRGYRERAPRGAPARSAAIVLLPTELSMTGTTVSSADLDPRRRRLLFRAWHRGTREMDLLMGSFADASLKEMSEDDLVVFEALCEVPDRDLFAWLTGKEDVASNYDTEIYRRLQAFHTHGGPIHV